MPDEPVQGGAKNYQLEMWDFWRAPVIFWVSDGYFASSSSKNFFVSSRFVTPSAGHRLLHTGSESLAAGFLTILSVQKIMGRIR